VLSTTRWPLDARRSGWLNGKEFLQKFGDNLRRVPDADSCL
jgi:hypothetical protein